MLPLIIAIIIGSIIIYKFYEFEELGLGLFIATTSAALIFISLVIIFGYTLPRTTVYTNKDLVAIQDGSSTTGSAAGSVFMGYGSIKEVPSYTYYVKDGDARLLESTTAKGVKVFEGGEKAYVREATACKSDYNWISPCINFEKVVEIHVPTGTIKQNFVLDAK